MSSYVSSSAFPCGSSSAFFLDPLLRPLLHPVRRPLLGPLLCPFWGLFGVLVRGLWLRHLPPGQLRPGLATDRVHHPLDCIPLYSRLPFRLKSKHKLRIKKIKCRPRDCICGDTRIYSSHNRNTFVRDYVFTYPLTSRLMLRTALNRARNDITILGLLR